MRNGMITNKYGDRLWYQNGQLHRTNGPAIEFASGAKSWYHNGLRHRTDGPAVEYANGTKMWCQNDQLHRIDGPAVEYASGAKSWYIKGVEYTFNEWLNLVDTTEVQKTLMRLQYA
jgi:hypothetical protein